MDMRGRIRGGGLIREGGVGADTIIGGVIGGIELGGVIIGGAISGAIGIIVTPSPLGDGTLQPGATVGMNAAQVAQSESGDCCEGHYTSIEKQLQIVKRRFSEYWEDPLDLPEHGPYPPGSRSGHRQGVTDAQRGLRNRLEAAKEAGCVAFPHDAWYWATRPIW